MHFADAVATHHDQQQQLQTAAYSRLLLQGKESEHQRELEHLLQGSGVMQRSRSESLDDLAGQAGQHLKEASHSEHVCERYEQLLQQHHHQKHQQSCNKQQQRDQQQHPTAGQVATVAGKTAYGTMLPNRHRHEEPVLSATFVSSTSELSSKNIGSSLRSASDAEYKHRPVNPSASAPAHNFDASESPPSEEQQGRGHHVESEEFSAEVVAFIQRALQQQQQHQLEQQEESVGADADSLDGPQQQDHPSSAGDKELEARWLLAGEAIRTHLTTSAQAQDLQKLRTNVQADMARTAALKAELAELSSSGSSSSSMEVLRGHINKTFDRLNLMERSNLIAHAQYRSLLGTLGGFREQALVVADAAVLHLSVQAEEARAVRKDARFGSVCLQVHQQSMGRIEVSTNILYCMRLVLISDANFTNFLLVCV